MKVIVHPEAQEELAEAVAHYDAKSSLLADDLLMKYEDALAKVRDFPDRWERIENDVRHCVFQRFPYSLVYRPKQETIFLLAVAHHSRRPGYWKRRLKDFKEEKRK